ncbi:gdsl-like lipase acylhydrolase [Phlyctema vagabunda]|uniref:Gdsl-like lipase acylhydrolase n=1 Tax=Phlyctema vagabunda TaxID=108571 RepID=A0ABR4PU54_9HELO
MRRFTQALYVLQCISSCSLAQGPTHTPLVILPLGDSITFGIDSSDGNGYRQDLERLIETRVAIQYVGSVRAGSMADNANEGHPGFRIDEIAVQATQNFKTAPNVVLLMAGTNDILQNRDVATAPDRLAALIDQLVAGIPTAAILVATLTPLLAAALEAERVTYNEAIPGIVRERAQAGKLVQVVDMSSVATTGIDSVDGIHPNDDGYAMMAQAWYAGVIEAASNGWIRVGNATTGNLTMVDSSSFAPVSSTTPAGSIAAPMFMPMSICTHLSLSITFMFLFSVFR